jgi:hypothetical protein
MEIKWEDGFEISVKSDGKKIILSANRAGLISLAKIINTLSAELPGSHFHLDEYNSLEEGSAELIIEKTI